MPPVNTEERQGALWIILARNPLNVLDLSTLAELRAAVEIAARRADLRAVVFRSALDGTFSAGSDVGDHTRERAPEMLEVFHGLIRRLETLPQCTVAAV